MELKNWWQILIKRRLWLGLVFAAVFLATFIYIRVTPATYQSSAKILVELKDRRLSTLDKTMGDLSELSTVSRTGNPVDTQIELAKSNAILQTVIERADLRQPVTNVRLTPEEFLQLGQAKVIKGTDLIVLSFQDENPKRAQQVSSTWAEVFVERGQANNQHDSTESVQFISRQLEKTKIDLQHAEAALRDFKRAHRAVDLTEEARSSVLTMSSIDGELRQATAALNEARSRANSLRGRIGLSSSQALASTALSQDPTLQQLRQQLLEAETNLSNITLAPGHPEVVQRKAQIAVLSRRLTEYSQALIGKQFRSLGVKETLDPVRQGLTKDLIQAESETLGYQTRLEALRRTASTYNNQLATLPEKEYTLTRLQRNAAVTSELYLLLQKKLEEARIQVALSVSNARIIDAGSLPEKPVKPQKLVTLGIGLVVGLLLGIALVAFLEYLDETIQTTEAAARILKLPIIGIIPWLRKSDFDPLIAFNQTRSPAAESYRTLRTNINFLSVDTMRLLTVTSAGTGEGKSTMLANLAVTFAKAGKRVLLVDADMRLPSLHAIFKLPNQRGLSSVLQGEATFAQSVQPSAQPNLDVLVCGPLPPDPAELLESERLHALLQEVRNSYDLVLFDAPPIVAVTDASILASRLDGLILQIGINRVTQKAAQHAVSLLNSAKVTLRGMVIAGVRPDNDPYYNTYYHRYYGKVERGHQRQGKKKRWPAA